MSNNVRVTILGVNIDAITIESAINKIIQRSDQPGASFVVKPYVEFFRGDHANLLNSAWLCLPDGVALQWAAYYQTTKGTLWQLLKTLSDIVLRPARLHQVLPDRFAGTNFTWPLLEAAAVHNRSVYLVGSPLYGDIKHTQKTLGAAIPELNIIGTLPGRDESGHFSPHLESRLLAALQELKPDIVLIGLGFPRQEELIARLLPQLQHGVLIGEGGTFDYQLFGGQRRKAPRIWQKLGVEWLWRLLLEPSRIKRQWAIPQFIWQIYQFTKSGSKAYHGDNRHKHKRIKRP
ncbi:MAG: WecB/TagA/CpsF family glycosyltransferase [Candidatus Saccharimonadales bacterium]